MLIKNRAYLAPDFMSEFDLRRRSREREMAWDLRYYGGIMINTEQK